MLAQEKRINLPRSKLECWQYSRLEAFYRRAISLSFSISTPNLPVRIASCLSVALRFLRRGMVEELDDQVLRFTHPALAEECYLTCRGGG
jgi:hypothetical protein